LRLALAGHECLVNLVQFEQKMAQVLCVYRQVQVLKKAASNQQINAIRSKVTARFSSVSGVAIGTQSKASKVSSSLSSAASSFFIDEMSFAWSSSVHRGKVFHINGHDWSSI
jgi:hypothetical protein